MTEPQPPAPNPAPEARTDVLPTFVRIVAILWFVISIVAGLNFINGTEYSIYGGDAYTGIQNAVARGTNALGFVIIGTGVIAVVAAFRRGK
jgi:hypothetical protein